MTVQHARLQPGVLQGMAALVLDVGFFTSEFRLCDTIAEYLADILAQSHEDPARYANFSSLLINEIIELAFRSADGTGKVDFHVRKDEERVRICVGFPGGKDSETIWQFVGGSSNSGPQHGPAGDLKALARALDVDIQADIDEDYRVTLSVEFFLSEDVR